MATKSSIPVGGLRLSRREFFRLGGGAVAGLVLVSCGATQTQAPTAVPAPTEAPAPTAAPAAPTAAAAAPTSGPAVAIKANLSSIKSGYDNPNWSHHVVDIVAREKGWLKEVGIDSAEDITFDDGITAIVGGGVDWTAGDTDVVLKAHVDNGVDVWWLGTRRDGEDLLFGLAPGVTVESLKGSGKAVSGGTVGSRNELLGKKMLKDLGLDPEKDVTWITLGGGSDTRLAALINGNLAGSNIQARHITQLEAAGGTVAYNKARTIAQDGFVVMGSYLKANPDTVTAYLTALIKAKQYIKDLSTKDEIIEIMVKQGYEFPQEFKDAYEANIHNMSADGGFEIDQMDLVWQELSEVGDAPADFDWRKGVNLEFLWKAQEANGLPRRPASL